MTTVVDPGSAGTVDRAQRPTVHQGAPWLVGAAIAALWAVAGLTRQATMRTGIDLGLYTQAVAGYAQGQWPWAPLKAPDGFNLLGDHFTPIVATLAPFYRWWPGPQTLLVAQAVLIGVAVGIVGRTAIRVLGRVGAGCAVAAAFGLSWGVTGMALFDFHEVAFAVPLLALSLDRAVAGRWRQAVLWSLPLMLVKEDGAFLIAGLAIACWAVGRRRLSVATMTFAIAAFFLVTGMIIPALSYSGTYTYWAVTGTHEGLIGGIGGLIGNLIASIGSGQAPLTMLLAAACTGFLAVRSPLAWVALPPLLVRFTSAQTEYWGPHAHYNATLMVIVFMAALDGWRRHGPPLSGRVDVRAAGIAALVAALFIGYFTPLWSLADPATYRCGERCAAADEALARVPDGETIIADTYLVDQLVDRTTTHLVAQQLVDSVGHPIPAEWVLVDTNNRGTFPELSQAYWWGSNSAQNAEYVPVYASTTGLVLLHHNPAVAAGFLQMYGAVACAASPGEAALCTTPPGDDTYRTRTAWCLAVDAPHLPVACPADSARRPATP